MSYSVYSHSINGQVFYVGSGVSATRPYAHDPRSHRWQMAVAGNAGKFDIQILSAHPDKAAARIEERRQIELLQPPANSQHVISRATVTEGASMRLPTDLLERVKVVARRKEWSLSKTLAKLIEKGLQRG